jgi:hypothetical protein
VVLANLGPLPLQLGREEDDERVSRVLIDLGPLVLVANVLQRQRVKPERLLEQFVIVITRVFDIEPEPLLPFLEAGEQAVGRGIERWAVGRDNVPDRALSLVALSVRDVGRRGTGPRRRYRSPT